MIRFRRGTSLLNKVVKQFDQAVADLDVAITQIEEKRLATLEKARNTTSKHFEKVRTLVAQHEQKLDDLAAKHDAKTDAHYDKEEELYRAKVRAETVRANIAKLVGAA